MIQMTHEPGETHFVECLSSSLSVVGRSHYSSLGVKAAHKDGNSRGAEGETGGVLPGVRRVIMSYNEHNGLTH